MAKLFNKVCHVAKLKGTAMAININKCSALCAGLLKNDFMLGIVHDMTGTIYEFTPLKLNKF